MAYPVKKSRVKFIDQFERYVNLRPAACAQLLGYTPHHYGSIRRGQTPLSKHVVMCMKALMLLEAKQLLVMRQLAEIGARRYFTKLPVKSQNPDFSNKEYESIYEKAFEVTADLMDKRLNAKDDKDINLI